MIRDIDSLSRKEHYWRANWKLKMKIGYQLSTEQRQGLWENEQLADRRHFAYDISNERARREDYEFLFVFVYTIIV